LTFNGEKGKWQSKPTGKKRFPQKKRSQTGSGQERREKKKKGKKKGAEQF